MNTVPIIPDFAPLDWFCGLTTRRLMQLWEDDRFDAHCDEVHAAMNMRGLGDMVAV